MGKFLALSGEKNFSLQAYKDIRFEKCFFLSPIVNMEYLIKNMFLWFHVTEEMLYAKREKAKGYAYSKDTPWQQQFEEQFRHRLTLCPGIITSM